MTCGFLIQRCGFVTISPPPFLFVFKEFGSRYKWVKGSHHSWNFFFVKSFRKRGGGLTDFIPLFYFSRLVSEPSQSVETTLWWSTWWLTSECDILVLKLLSFETFPSFRVSVKRFWKCFPIEQNYGYWFRNLLVSGKILVSTFWHCWHLTLF